MSVAQDACQRGASATAVVQVPGPLDRQTIRLVTAALTRGSRAGQWPQVVVLDLAGVPHLDRVGVRALLAWRRVTAVRGQRLVLERLSDGAIDVLSRSGVLPLFAVDDFR
jgi:anti-anti-sigma factor